LSLTNSFGIPIVNSINKGNEHDSTFLISTMQQLFDLGINSTTFKEKKRTKMTILGDSSYDSKKIREYINNNNMDSIIDYNNRNTKDPKKIKHFTDKEKEKYKNRIIIENSHAWKETKIPRMGKIYDKKFINYVEMNFLSIIDLILNRNIIALKNI